MQKETITLTPDELGDVGESLFRSLAATARLVANSSDIDKKGWDFFIQPGGPRSASDEMLDKRTEWSCHVQLKATAEKKPTSVRVKLSTFETFAKLPGPSLLVVFALHPDGRPKKGFLVHIIGDQLRRVLRRLRQAEAKGDADLAKETLSFDYTAKGSPFELTPEGLRAAIEGAVGKDQGTYVKEKLRQLEELGYEDAELVGHAVFRVERDDQLARVALGLETLKSSAMQVYDARFGIPIPYIGSLFDDLADMYVTPPEMGTWRVAMKGGGALEAAASFDVKLHLAPPELRGPHALLKHDDFTITFDEVGLQFETVNLFNETRRSLGNWCNLLRGLAHLADGKGSLAITTAPGSTYHFPVAGRLNGPDLLDLPRLRDFLEGWQRLVEFAGCSAPEAFTIDEAKASWATQMAVGLALDPDPPGHLEFDIEGDGHPNELQALYFDNCSFAGANISYSLRVALRRGEEAESTFRSAKFELVDIRPQVTDLKQYGRDRAELEGLHILLDPDMIERT
ncbi:MAG: hypothetical protein AAF999_17710 [Pseudomonadota bacterium]